MYSFIERVTYYVYSGQTIACCLWGTFAEKIHTEVEASGEYVVVCLLRFAKIGKYRGKVVLHMVISNY